MVIWLLMVGSAWAQDAPEPPTEAPAGPVVAAVPRTYATGWRWVRVGPNGLVNPLDVAIHPIEEGVWASVSGDGGVWLTRDGGEAWRQILPNMQGQLSEDETLLVEVEARITELSDGVEPPPPDEFIDEDELAEFEAEVEAARDAGRDAADQLQSELEGDRWFLDGPVSTEATPWFRPRVSFTDEGSLVVARPDGLFSTADLVRWVQLLDFPVTAVAQAALTIAGADLWVGTPSGLYRWVEAEQTRRSGEPAGRDPRSRHRGGSRRIRGH